MMQTEDRQTSSTFQPNIPQDPSRTPNLSADLFRSSPQAGLLLTQHKKEKKASNITPFVLLNTVGQSLSFHASTLDVDCFF